MSENPKTGTPWVRLYDPISGCIATVYGMSCGDGTKEAARRIRLARDGTILPGVRKITPEEYAEMEEAWKAKAPPTPPPVQDEEP